MDRLSHAKVCTKCKSEKQLDKFPEKENKKFHSWCKDCKLAGLRELYAKRKAVNSARVIPYDGMKTCCRCKQEKHVTEFSVARNDASGRRKHCRSCSSELTRNANRKNPQKYASIRRRASLKRCYGITESDYENMLKSQGGVCAICRQFSLRKDGFKMPVDHCHDTGAIRGILCHNCNCAIGKFKEDSEVMLRAAEYIEKHRRRCS